MKDEMNRKDLKGLCVSRIRPILSQHNTFLVTAQPYWGINSIIYETLKLPVGHARKILRPVRQ